MTRQATTTRKRTTPEPAPPQGTRVAIYVRISTDEAHQPFSLEAQRHRLAAFIPTQPGWAHTATYEDQVSGAKEHRPALDRALRDARLGRFDVLLVYRVDRFARSLKVLVGLLEELDSAGVAFRSATEPIDTATATGRMLVQLLGVFAEFERATIIDRVINGMERKAARGCWPGGKLPHGLDLDADRHLIVRQPEFALIERLFSTYADGSQGAAAIAAALNAGGQRTSTGRPWSAKAVLDLLRNRSFLGDVYFRGTWYQSSEKPIISPEVFARVQAILESRGEGYGQRFTTRRPEYLLTGLVRCGKCRRRYVGVSANGKRHRYRYYMCWTRSRYGVAGCDAERLRADELEEAAFGSLLAVYADPDLLRDASAARLAADQAGVEQREQELVSVDGERRKVEAAIERYMLAFENGSVTEEAFGPRVRELGEQAQALRAHQAEVAAGIAAAHSGRLPSAEDLLVVHRQLREALDTAPDTVRKAIAQAFVDELYVEARDRILPTYRVLAGIPDQPERRCANHGVRAGGVRTMTPTVRPQGLEP